MARPVDRRFKMGFGFGKQYPAILQEKLGLISHQGQDFYCPSGTPVLAVADGWLLGFGERRAFGELFEELIAVGRLWWKKWFIVRYAHLTKNSARFSKHGEKIGKGEMIAYSDATGTIYRDDAKSQPREHPHLHIEVWEAKKVAGAWARTKLISPAFLTGEEGEMQV
jgi:murein DD-endopeptidase MepM/ murein hydrolase activator NlpD